MYSESTGGCAVTSGYHPSRWDLSQSGNGIVMVMMNEVAARNIATFSNACDVTVKFWPTDFATKSERKMIKMTKESKGEWYGLICANRTAISLADVKHNAITTFCHWGRNWFGLICCSVFGIGAETRCDSESSSVRRRRRRGV